MKNNVSFFHVLIKALLYGGEAFVSVFAIMALVSGFTFGELIFGMGLFVLAYFVTRFLKWINHAIKVDIPFFPIAKKLQCGMLLIMIGAYLIPGMGNKDLYTHNCTYLNEACAIDNRAMVLINALPGTFSADLLHVALDLNYTTDSLGYTFTGLCFGVYGYVSVLANAVKITKIEDKEDE